MSLIPLNPTLTFETRAIDFIGPFPRLVYRIGARYIVTVVEYVTKWVEEEPAVSCTKEVDSNFIYQNIITIFGCPITLISDRGKHFINQSIEILMKEYMIDHHKSSAYHPQANGTIESFNKTLTKGLTKICNVNKNYLDDKIPTILWDYRIDYKRSTCQTPFRMVYGQEAVVPLHFKQQAPKIAQVLKLDLTKAKEDRLFQLQKLEEDELNAIHYQEVHKQQKK